MRRTPWRALGAELIGTALLLWAIVGSGIAVADRGTVLVQLVLHALVVGGALAAIIAVLGPVSGAHLNPVVTLATAAHGNLPRARVPGYLIAQLAGAVLGTLLANRTAGLPAVTVATRSRDGAMLLASEVVATTVLVALILLMVRAGRSVSTLATAVGTYIAAAIVLTPSTSFANPVVTLARTLSDTFTGIAPASVRGFVVAQLVGGALAVIAVRALDGRAAAVVDDDVSGR